MKIGWKETKVIAPISRLTFGLPCMPIYSDKDCKLLMGGPHNNAHIGDDNN